MYRSKKELLNKCITRKITAHVKALGGCRRCPQMYPPPVSGAAVASKILLIGQAPGDKEPKLGRPFAWTAGKNLFSWFNHAAGINEEQFRSAVYMAAVCRCFPGKHPLGGDRVPSPQEVLNCSVWLKRELAILQPRLVIPVGKLAIAQFLPPQKLNQVIGRKFLIDRDGISFDLIPLPHPSGASPWHRQKPGKLLLKKALQLIVSHPVFNFKPGD